MSKQTIGLIALIVGIASLVTGIIFYLVGFLLLGRSDTNVLGFGWPFAIGLFAFSQTRQRQK